jgi:hypothetical protein
MNSDYLNDLASVFARQVTCHVLPETPFDENSERAHFFCSFIIPDEDKPKNPTEPSGSFTEPCLRELGRVINELGKPVSFVRLPTSRLNGVQQSTLRLGEIILRHTVSYDGVGACTQYDGSEEEAAGVTEADFVPTVTSPAGHRHSFDCQVVTFSPDLA